MPPLLQCDFYATLHLDLGFYTAKLHSSWTGKKEMHEKTLKSIASVKNGPFSYTMSIPYCVYRIKHVSRYGYVVLVRKLNISR